MAELEFHVLDDIAGIGVRLTLLFQHGGHDEDHPRPVRIRADAHGGDVLRLLGFEA